MNNINTEKVKQLLKNTKKLVLHKVLPFVLATTFVVGAGTVKSKAESSNSIIEISLSDLKNDDIDTSKLYASQTLVKIPQIDVVQGQSTINFKTIYVTEAIEEKDLKMYNQAIDDVDIFYSRIEAGLDKGNYKKNNNEDSEDVLLAFYGDTNLVNQTINEKYQYYTGLKKAINKYLNYKQTLLSSKVYNKNTIKYEDFVKYQTNNTPVRISEENGKVYYKLNNTTVSVTDKGYIKTSDLKSSVSVLTNVQIKAYTGLNIYIDGKLYEPTDANGVAVNPFVYNGTTYLPARAISNVFNTNIEWKNGNVYITNKETDDDTYYIDANGNKVYLNTYPEVPTTNKTPEKKLVEKTLTGYKGIKIYYNGNQFTPTDANGKSVETYVFNGTTYLPVRAISNLFNAEINWNNSLNGVTINRYPNLNIPNDNYYTEENGNKVEVPEEDIDFGNTIVNKPYYIDDNGNKVYIDDNDYQKTR